MYIGPWQEYNLSKKTGANKVNAQLRPSIEQALLSTLDPETAKKALEAMTPYFDKQSSSGAPIHNPSIPSHVRAREQRQRMTRAYPTLDSARNRSMAAAGERLMHTSSPLSVRSTQSEPIRYSNAMSSATIQQPATPKLQEIPDASHYRAYSTNIPITETSAPHTQPAYNASAMLNLLRLERNTQARSQIAKLTGWKADPSTLSDNGATERKRKVEIANDQKLEQVNMMKQLYMSGGQQPTVDGAPSEQPATYNGSSGQNPQQSMKLTSDNLARFNKESILRKDVGNMNVLHQNEMLAKQETPASASELKTPRINDIDLTDEAFSLISKYFQPGELSNGAASISMSSVAYERDSQRDAGITNKVPLSKAQLSVLRANGVDTPINDDMSSGRGSPATVLRAADGLRDAPRNRSDHLLVPATPNAIGQEGDELFAGGMDSLLLWSSQLELDIS